MTIYDIKFDATHDMTLNGSDISFAENANILTQRITIRLQFLLEEWFLNNTSGLPYTQFIFEHGSTIEDIYEIFRKEINETDGVKNITELELVSDASEKNLQVTFSVNDNTSSGSVEVII